VSAGVRKLYLIKHAAIPALAEIIHDWRFFFKYLSTETDRMVKEVSHCSKDCRACSCPEGQFHAADTPLPCPNKTFGSRSQGWGTWRDGCVNHDCW
jgi:hypothetical protein